MGFQMPYQTKELEPAPGARIMNARYDQLDGRAGIGLYTDIVDKQVLSTFFVSNNKFG